MSTCRGLPASLMPDMRFVHNGVQPGAAAGSVQAQPWQPALPASSQTVSALAALAGHAPHANGTMQATNGCGRFCVWV